MRTATKTNWPADPPYATEMYATVDAGSLGLRPSGEKWIAATVTRSGTVFSRPFSWRMVRHWIDENGIDSEDVKGFHPIGAYTSIFDVHEVGEGGAISERVARANTEQDVYFIQCGDTGPIKIGVATDVAKRLGALQTACPFTLRVLATSRGGLALERQLHSRFAGDRLRGEWFLPTAELLALIGATA